MFQFISRLNFYYLLALPSAAFLLCCIYCNNVNWIWATGWVLNLVYILFFLAIQKNTDNKSSKLKTVLSFTGLVTLIASNIAFNKNIANFLVENTLLEMTTLNLAIMFLAFKFNKGMGLLGPTLLLVGLNLAFCFGLILNWLELNNYEINTTHLLGVGASFIQIFYARFSLIINHVNTIGCKKQDEPQYLGLILGLIFFWLSTPLVIMLVRYCIS